MAKKKKKTKKKAKRKKQVATDQSKTDYPEILKGKWNKHPIEVSEKCMALYATGKSLDQVAKETGVKLGTIKQWHHIKYPDSWKKMREQFHLKTRQKLQEEQLDKITSMRARQQKAFRAVGGATGNQIIRKAQANQLEDRVALEAFQTATEEERKLYIDEKNLYENRGGPRGSFAAKYNAETGELGLMGYLEDQYRGSRDGDEESD